MRPELAVRQQYAALPGGPSETETIAAVSSREATMLEQAAELDGKSPPRPSPPLYLPLREDVLRFVDGLATIPRMLLLLEGASRGNEAALQEAAIWLDNSTAAGERLAVQYPGYLDVVQPVQLAVQEVRYGLGLVIGAARLAAKGPAVHAVSSAATHLMAFPRQPATTPIAQLESPEAQTLVASMAAAAVEQRAASIGALAAEEDRQSAGLMARLNALRTAIHEACQTLRQAPTSAARAIAASRLDNIFGAVVIVWEDLKEEEARRAAEEAELYKTKTRSASILSEEQEAEIDFARQFPDQFGAFSDLVDDEDGPPLDGQEPKPADADTSAAAGAAAFSARSFILETILQDVVRAHADLFRNAAVGGADQAQSDDDVAAFKRSYALGMELVRQAGGLLPAELDDATLTGHLYAVCAHASELRVGQAEVAASADIHTPRAEEAVLAQEPLENLRHRLGELLQEWPDHPVLMQLDAIADRILNMSATAPLKGLLTGLELLLARALVWEETAAKHVTLGAHLKAIAALATRWRKLELDSWRALLHRTAERSVLDAQMGWFHLHRILLLGDSPVPEVAKVLEDFIQNAPVGEYSTRLDLLRTFHHHLGQAATDTEDPNQATRWRKLAAILYNVYRYYAQFLGAVQATVAAGMAPLEKDLKDFVALAKWEDRGFYAMKASTERAQRHLHKLCRRATEVLKGPVAGTLAVAAKAMGLDDLAAPESVGESRTRKALKPDGAAVVQVLAASTAADAALPPVTGPPLVIPPEGGKFTQRLPDLIPRFAGVVANGLASDNGVFLKCALSADDMASEAASTAVRLRQDITKGAKARKKKALVDFFKALGAAGVSKLRASIPANRRGVQAWFGQAAPRVDIMLEGVASIAPEQHEAAKAAWAKADAYNFASMARVQRLLEVSE